MTEKKESTGRNLVPLVKASRAVKTLGKRLDAVTEYVAPSDTDPMGTPSSIARSPITFGAWMLFLVFGVFGLWATFAPLSSAAVAPGSVALDANRKTIQHLEGGIVQEILVREGERVKEGQVLVKLNPIEATARLDLFRGQKLALTAAELRLIAERDEAKELTFPEELINEAKALDQQKILDSQLQIFRKRRDTLQSQVSILGQKVEQSKREIQGLRAQVTSATDQITLLNEEIRVVKELLETGNAVKPRLLSLERNRAELEGRRGSAQAQISRAEQTITESEFSILGQKNDFASRVAQELKETQEQLADVTEKLRASVDVAGRVVITAPVDGLITGLAVHTVGGVVRPGDKLMDIVPIGDKLIVQANVDPRDIDVVHAGLLARVRLTAYKARTVPPVDGIVVNVSADRFTDERTGEAYFIARIEVDPAQFEKMEDVELSPGMPADVLIVTGERTLLQYLVAPLSDAMRHAFREQ